MTITEKIDALIGMSDTDKTTPITVTIHRTHAEESPDANTPTVWDVTELLEISVALKGSI